MLLQRVVKDGQANPEMAERMQTSMCELTEIDD